MKKIVKMTITDYHNHLAKMNVIKKNNYFYCTQCDYMTNRKYHAKMHFIRIHVNNGNHMETKRKY
jgi:hypothetical protein